MRSRCSRGYRTSTRYASRLSPSPVHSLTCPSLYRAQDATEKRSEYAKLEEDIIAKASALILNQVRRWA